MTTAMKRAYTLAQKDIGTWEWEGEDDNPKVVEYFADVGHDWVKDDETAWCAAFVGAMLERTGTPSTRKLNARSYLAWGEPYSLEEAKPGDLVIFWRGSPESWQGHVGFYVSHNSKSITVLGGNQSDQVNEAKYPVTRLLGVRRWVDAPPWPDLEPAVPMPDPPRSWLAVLIDAILSFFKREKR